MDNVNDKDGYFAWWSSIETDLRKSLLVGAQRDPATMTEGAGNKNNK